MDDKYLKGKSTSCHFKAIFLDALIYRINYNTAKLNDWLIFIRKELFSFTYIYKYITNTQMLFIWPNKF